MDSAVIVAIIGTAGAIISASIPVLVSLFKGMRKMEHTVGVKNGQGTLAEMQGKMLKVGEQLIQSNSRQDERLTDIEELQFLQAVEQRHQGEQLHTLCNRVESIEKTLE